MGIESADPLRLASFFTVDADEDVDDAVDMLEGISFIGCDDDDDVSPR